MNFEANGSNDMIFTVGAERKKNGGGGRIECLL